MIVIHPQIIILVIIIIHIIIKMINRMSKHNKKVDLHFFNYMKIANKMKMKMYQSEKYQVKLWIY
jgi:hypothetical protein